MKLEIFDAIDDYQKSCIARFHTPGHKGELSKRDITEIDDTFPADAIEKAQNSAAKFFSSKACRFLTGGSSMGMKASIMAVKGDILAPVDRHQCVDEGATLAGVKIFDLDCKKGDNGLYNLPTVEDIDQYLDRYPSIKAVVLQSPDYYGRVIKKEVAQRVKERNKLLIVDSAHGAHFCASPLLPSSYSSYADFCNLSGHKTMACFTQSAYLTLNNLDYLCKVDEVLKLLGTTSPSYLLLGGLEYGIEHAKQNCRYYEVLFESIKRIKGKVQTLPNDDFTRLVVDTGDKNRGKELYFALKQRGIVAEKYDERFVVFIITLCDEQSKLAKLEEELVCVVNSLR